MFQELPEEHSIGTTKHLTTISVLIAVSYEVKSKRTWAQGTNTEMKMFARNRGTHDCVDAVEVASSKSKLKEGYHTS